MSKGTDDDDDYEQVLTKANSVTISQLHSAAVTGCTASARRSSV